MKFEVTIIKKYTSVTNTYIIKNTTEKEGTDALSKYFDYLKNKLDIVDYKIKIIEGE